MPRPSSHLPDELGDGFSAAQARLLGVGQRRLNRSDATRVARGLYVRSSRMAALSSTQHPDELWRLRQFAAATAISSSLPSHVFFSGITAAAIWGLPIPSGVRQGLEVSTFHPHHAPRRAGLRSSQVQPRLVTVIERDRLRVTDPPSTWAMLAYRLSLPDSVALGDAVIREARIPGTSRLERMPLAELADLERIVGRGRRRGVARLREALPLLSPHSASAPESHLRLLVNEWGLPVPVLDFDVYDHTGRLLGCSELAYPELRLALEYESWDHMAKTRQWNRDLEKYYEYMAIGWEPFRVSAQMLYRERPRLRHKLHETLIRRGWDGV